MSHFVVAVLVGDRAVTLKSPPKVLNAAVAKLLAPYDENMDVPEYESPCSCVGEAAKSAVRDEIEKKHGNFDKLRGEFAAKYPKLATAFEGTEEEQHLATFKWQLEFLNPRKQLENNALALHPGRYKIDPECSQCEGTGKYVSTRNPKSKWDWWQIGGRWTGFFLTKAQAMAAFSVVADANARLPLSSNLIKVETLLKRRSSPTPYAIVTPDGEWHQRAEMGWFGASRDEVDPDTWDKRVHELLSKYPKAIAVACDLHI